jgi:peptidyl-prolyl cis-trans isomerase-like protein 2
LNKKPKNWHDLITEEPFSPADIISIQDPKKEKERQLCNFDYIKNSLPFVAPDKLTPQINTTNTIARVL